jgi:hypothetical protein
VLSDLQRTLLCKLNEVRSELAQLPVAQPDALLRQLSAVRELLATLAGVASLERRALQPVVDHTAASV